MGLEQVTVGSPDSSRRWCCYTGVGGAYTWSKNEHTMYNRELRKTGGGDPPLLNLKTQKSLMDFIKDEFKVPESEFDCDNVKPAIIQQYQQESPDTPVCTILVGEDDFIDADLLDATGLPNQQGPHSRAANNSAVVATFEEPTEDEERRASFREKEELDKNILEEKLASFREKEELEEKTNGQI
ncbi:hypothetical protein Pcinc_023663 [Petrolisthes cinctipes]|uniref:Uncharacterized protein n=1 Tax=Petrolisthes cinctipes TaxID=88211 RepID=A0AAE1FDZ4_PETCI|nr:hypothetical protein Pcinc_023663 [Petrolisthes cinctipes]